MKWLVCFLFKKTRKLTQKKLTFAMVDDFSRAICLSLAKIAPNARHQQQSTTKCVNDHLVINCTIVVVVEEATMLFYS